MTIFRMEFHKIVSKKYVWIFAIVIATFYAITLSGSSSSFGRLYHKALQPIFDEVNAAAYDPTISSYIIEKQYNVTVEEIKPFLSPEIEKTIESYKGQIYQRMDVSDILWKKVKDYVVNLVTRIEDRKETIAKLEASPDTPLNRYLLNKYTNMPKIQANMTQWDSWIDTNKSLLPIVIAFVILLGTSGVFSDEYSSKMHGILLTCKKGRKEVFWAKLEASALFSAICALIFQLFNAVIAALYYGVPFTNTPLNSLTLFYQMPTTLSAMELYIFEILGSVVGAVVLSFVTMCISSICHSNFLSFFISGIYFAIGFVLSNALEANFEQGGYLSTLLTLPGDVSTFSLMSLVNVFGNGKVFATANFAIPTVLLTIVVQAVIFVIAIALIYYFYNRREVIA